MDTWYRSKRTIGGRICIIVLSAQIRIAGAKKKRTFLLKITTRKKKNRPVQIAGQKCKGLLNGTALPKEVEKGGLVNQTGATQYDKRKMGYEIQDKRFFCKNV